MLLEKAMRLQVLKWEEGEARVGREAEAGVRGFKPRLSQGQGQGQWRSGARGSRLSVVVTCHGASLCLYNRDSGPSQSHSPGQGFPRLWVGSR